MEWQVFLAHPLPQLSAAFQAWLGNVLFLLMFRKSLFTICETRVILHLLAFLSRGEVPHKGRVLAFGAWF